MSGYGHVKLLVCNNVQYFGYNHVRTHTHENSHLSLDKILHSYSLLKSHAGYNLIRIPLKKEYPIDITVHYYS